MIKYALYGMGILLAVFVIAVITPRLAGFIDKQAAKHKSPERVQDKDAPDVKGIYDAQLPTAEDEEKAKEVRGIYDSPIKEKQKTDDNGDVDNGRQ